MTAQRIPSIIFQSFYPGTNLPLNGGKVWTWKAGTTGDSNLQTTWSDASQNAENTNPVTLDANGKANIFGGSAAYHILVTDSDGNTIDDQDNVFFGTPNGNQIVIATLADLRSLPFGNYDYVVTESRMLQGDGGGGDWDWNSDTDATDDGVFVVAPNSLPTTGRWIRRFNGPVNAAWGGVLDNAQSINANLTALMTAAGNRTVWFPLNPSGSGQYAVTADFTFTDGTSIMVDDGAFFSIDSGFTLVLGCDIKKSATTLFTGDGSVSIQNPLQVVVAEWFGIKSTVSNNLVGITALIGAVLTTQAIVFPDARGYQSASDPGIPGYQGSITNAGDIYKTGDSSTVYLAHGVHLSTTNGDFSGRNIALVGDGTVGGNLAITGNFSTGGTFSAASLASLSGDVTAFRYFIGKRHAGTGTMVYTPGGMVAKNLVPVTVSTTGTSVLQGITVAPNTMLNNGDSIELFSLLQYTKTTNTVGLVVKLNTVPISASNTVLDTGYWPIKITLIRLSSSTMAVIASDLFTDAGSTSAFLSSGIATADYTISMTYEFFIGTLGTSDVAKQWITTAKFIPVA